MKPDLPSQNQIGPPARGERRTWEGLPEPLRDAFERQLCAKVLRAESEPGGFSPGVAARLSLSDGRRIFAKVVGREPNPTSPDVHREEIKVLSQMAPAIPTPRLLSTYDRDDWVALFLEEIDGHTPQLPWRALDLERVVHAIETLAQLLTPAPFSARTYAERHSEMFAAWHEMSEAREKGADDLSDLNPWARSHLPVLVQLEGRLSSAAAGNTLLHSDLRADNILLTNDRVYFADWPGACVGARWIDLLGCLPSVAMQGGPPPWRIFDESPLSQDAKEDDVNAVLSALTGFFLGNARKPAPPGLSTLRPFQRARGVEALAWLRHRLSDD